MKNPRINYEYLNSGNEIPLLLRLEYRNRNKKQIENPKKILIVDSCLIGDFAVVVHAIREITKLTKAKVDLLVPSPVKPLAEKIIGINKVYLSRSVCSRDIEKKAESQSFPEYDLVIILRIGQDAYDILNTIKYKSLKTYLKAFLKYVPSIWSSMIIGKKLKQWHTFNFEIIERPEKRYKLEEIFNFNGEKSPALPGNSGRKKIIIHTGSGWAMKLWENDKWIDLLNKINAIGKYDFIFVGGAKKELDDFEVIKKKLKFKIYSLIKKVNVKELLLIMKKSDYFIGIDSGPRNLAHLADLRSISLLGPSTKNFMSYNSRDIIIDKSKCRFCPGIFCYKKKRCMEKIQIDEVFEAFKKLSNYSKI